MGEKFSGASFAPKLELFPSVKKETDKVVLWHEHVTKEAKLNEFRNSNARFIIADPRSLSKGKMAPVTEKGGMQNAAHKTHLVQEANAREIEARGRRSTGMNAAELQAAAWGAKQASARNKGSARNGTWGRQSARNRLSMHLGQRAESLMTSIEITDGERRISGLGGRATQSYEELPTDFKFDIGAAATRCFASFSACATGWCFCAGAHGENMPCR
jgi:hypothetical protein